MINPGTYAAKITDYGLYQKEGKAPSVMVQFQLIETPEKITWFGSLKEGKAREFTTKTLVQTLGYKGTDGSDLAQGQGSEVLSENKHFELVVEHNTYQGKTSARVKYINEPGGGVMANKVDASSAKVVVGGLNLSGDFLKAQQEMPKVVKEEETDVDF